MIIYIDPDFKCHIENDGMLREIETDEFNGKCAEYVEGFRFVPSGETYVRADGEKFTGQMVSNWKPFDELEKAQAAWEHEQFAALLAERDALLDDMQALIDEILGGDEDV